MTYTTSTTKTKAAQYDLPGIEDMVPNIWSPVKVAYDRYALWGIAHWREQRKFFYAFARGMQRIMAVTHVSVMRKHGYGYLEEIVMRRADNALYRFKEGDFPRLWINDIEDMLLLVVQNRLHNLIKGNVADFGNSLKDVHQLDYPKYQHRVLAEEKMEQFGKENSLFHDQGHQQAAKGKEDDEEFGEIHWWHRHSNPMIQPEPEGSAKGYPLVSVEVLRFDTPAGNPIKKILLKLNLFDHRLILTDSKEYLKMVMEDGVGGCPYRLANSSSVHSHPTGPLLSQEAWARAFTASQDQLSGMYQQLITANILMTQPAPLDPRQFVGDEVATGPLLSQEAWARAFCDESRSAIRSLPAVDRCQHPGDPTSPTRPMPIC
ncbi:hypothetical protein Tco_0359481 [Tanacetum coccineum]